MDGSPELMQTVATFLVSPAVAALLVALASRIQHPSKQSQVEQTAKLTEIEAAIVGHAKRADEHYTQDQRDFAGIAKRLDHLDVKTASNGSA